MRRNNSFLLIEPVEIIKMNYDFDLFVIGAGSGGIATARRAAEYGAKVGIV